MTAYYNTIYMKTILLNLLLLVSTFNLATGQTNFYDKMGSVAI